MKARGEAVCEIIRQSQSNIKKTPSSHKRLVCALRVLKLAEKDIREIEFRLEYRDT